jgi:integrase/recombinase XerD
MANRQCNLTKRIRLQDNSTRYAPVAISDNGRVKRDTVIVNGNEEKHPEGSYYIEWWCGKKRIRLSVGKDHTEAGNRRLRKEAELTAVAHGAEIVPDKAAGQSLKESVAEYLEEVRIKQQINKPLSFNRHSTHGVYSVALNYFLESCHKLTLEELDRKDLLKFAEYLTTKKERPQSARSANHKLGIVVSFLKAYGIHGLIGKQDWPRYTEPEPEIYEEDELNTFFAACDEDERLWFEFFLVTGMREQELMFTYWSDIKFAAHAARVSHKPDLGWSPKAYKEREIPIPEIVALKLQALHKKSDRSCKLLFPTSGCKPKRDFLDCLKAIAKRAKLDPKVFWLHKFRSTFATRSLWAGVDLKTVQYRLGHSDMESTMRYLRASRSKEARAAVNEIFAFALENH